MVRNTSSMRFFAATVAPWRRISTSQYGPSALASERPSSGLSTRRLVSPNSSRLSQNGTFSPICAPM